VKVGILEFRDNEFMRSVMAGLAGVETELLRVGQLVHPSPPCHQVIVDRVSFCDPFLRQVMRYWSLGGAYVLNNPFHTLVFDKLAEMLCYDRLAIAHPRTLLLPRVNEREDVREMVAEPDWKAVEERIGFPCILKPVDGYAWQDVFKVSDPEMLRALYESLKESRTLLVQELVRYSAYYRAFCVNRSEVFIVSWSPQPFDRGVYAMPDESVLGPARDVIVAKTAALNALLGLDFNTVEWCVREDGTPVLIDSYNDVPDVRPEKLPPACYAWIVGRFCACVRDKLATGARNSLGEMFRGSEAGALPR
jgi:hypothetical protein